MSESDRPASLLSENEASNTLAEMQDSENHRDVQSHSKFEDKVQKAIRHVVVDPIKKGVTKTSASESIIPSTRPIRTAVANMNKKMYDKVVNRKYDPVPYALRMYETKEQQEAMEEPDVPPDVVLHNMDDIILRKVLKGVSVKDYYETIWSEGVGCDREPFYGPWLSDGGKNKVNVKDWEFAEPGNEFEAWQNEKFPQKRTIDLEFVRTTHLYAGPPVINVHHTHYCRTEGDDRCVVAKVIQIEGIPLADSFETQIRWVASRTGTSDLLIEVGVAIIFVKSTMLASKIKAGAIEETTKGQTNLFECMVDALEAETAESERVVYEPEPQVAEEEELTSCSRFGNFLSRLLGRRGILADRNDSVAVGLRGVDEKLKSVISALEQSNVHLEREKEILEGLSSANKSLEQVLLCLS